LHDSARGLGASLASEGVRERPTMYPSDFDIEVLELSLTLKVKRTFYSKCFTREFDILDLIVALRVEEIIDFRYYSSFIA